MLLAGLFSRLEKVEFSVACETAGPVVVGGMPEFPVSREAGNAVVVVRIAELSTAQYVADSVEDASEAFATLPVAGSTKYVGSLSQSHSPPQQYTLGPQTLTCVPRSSAWSFNTSVNVYRKILV